MKKSTFLFLFFQGLALVLCLLSACKKDGVSSCETVLDGSQFLKVVNKSGGTIFVDMTSIVPFGAEVRDGACELYGLPQGSHTVTIENEDGPGSRDVDFDLSGGETWEVVVDGDYF